jgi:hypothetical protein
MHHLHHFAKGALWALALLASLGVLFGALPGYIGRAAWAAQDAQGSSLALVGTRLEIGVSLIATLVKLALACLMYPGCILISCALIAPYIGGSELAIVVSTLLIAALLLPMRRRIQNLIDRRFYRRKYDAAKVLAAFGVTTRDETDLARLTDALVQVVDETVQPEFVGLWLREPASQRLPDKV